MGELKKLVEEGKIKYIGLSEASVNTIKRAHVVHPITAIQMEYSLWTREIEEEIIPLCRYGPIMISSILSAALIKFNSLDHLISYCYSHHSFNLSIRELGIGIVAYGPLGHGFFGGKAVAESLPNESLLVCGHSCTPLQLALAWLFHQGEDIIPIPGTTKVKNMVNNIGALAVKLITEEDLKEISDAVPVDEVSRLGFGCAGLSGFYNASIPHEAGCSIIKEAFSKGITIFDTADIYGDDHDNEIMVGKALKQLPRDKIQLATKFGLFKSGEEIGVKGTPEYVRECCEASLKRLDVDYIDLYYQHRVDTSVPIEDTMGELKKLVEEGKIKYIGLSEASVDTIRRAHAVHPITAVQMEYSLWAREIEEDIIPLCRELGIGIVSYCPLGRGFFGGKAVVESLHAESILAGHPRFIGENLEKNKLIYSHVSNLAAKLACTPPQLALAWLLHQGDDIIPIPGTTKVKNLDDNIGSLALKLTEDNLKEICDAVPIDEVGGSREFRTTKVKNMVNNIGALAVKLEEEDLKEISDVVPVDGVSGSRELDVLAKFCWKLADTPSK
ncbi:hypothetical protein LWI29_035445 [Acer saccharum]|uniref:NADP-dependent oxidoreductase domain-containing protein n=1 Tax=Acer saccharum TaxID=4024 RepID=A0AA39WBJ4_ACESA|nr:hypothetical protein LWI29_035445 [Acer saccharum]